MNGFSFRSLSLCRLFPGPGRCKQAALATAILIASGCGGDGSEEAEEQTIRAAGYQFAAPGGWDVSRGGRSVTASDGDAAVSVTVFRLARPYRAALWERVVPELDGVARRLAARLGATVTQRSTRTVAGRRARLYVYAGARDDTRRILFLLAGRSEYQLLCRWADARATDGEAACRQLLAGFRLAAA